MHGARDEQNIGDINFDKSSRSFFAWSYTMGVYTESNKAHVVPEKR